MIDTLNFRAATLADIPFLVPFVNAAYRGESSKAGWTTEADLLDGVRVTEDSLKTILEEKETILYLGFAGTELLCCVQLVNKGEIYYLGMLTVKPDLQNAGLGKKLLAFCEDLAKREGKTAIEMTVISDRVELIAWYERKGYYKTGEKRPFPMGDIKFGLPKKELEFLVLQKTL